MSDRSDERRAHPRFSTSLKVCATPEVGGIEARMVANNLSLGGLYCTSNADYPEMTRLAVRLMLPDRMSGNGETEPVDLEAVVVRRQPLPSSTGSPRFQLALFFTQLDDAAREQISRFLA